MRSIKPGRGPSTMGAMGSVAVGLFGIFWTVGASSMGAPSFFVFFGVIFVLLAIIQAIYHFKNATGTNRMSEFDITESGEEPDPLDKYHKKPRNVNVQDYHVDTDSLNFCPYCGYKVNNHTYAFCPKCGKEIREDEN